MDWRIEQQSATEWMVYRGDQRHWARTAEDAVALLKALKEADL